MDHDITCPSRVSSLYHEVSDYSVELYIFIVSSPAQFSEIPACCWSMFPIQLYHNGTHADNNKV